MTPALKTIMTLIGLSLLLVILKFTVLTGMSWVWALSPIWVSLVPWVFTVLMLWIYGRK